MAKKNAKMAASFLDSLRQPEPEVPVAADEPGAEMNYDAILGIDDIQPHPYNREVNIEDESARALRESILANGFTDKVQVLTRENAEALGVEGLGPQPYVALNCHHRLDICRKYRPDILTVEAVVRSFRTRLEMLYVIVDYNASRPLSFSERSSQVRRIKAEVQSSLRPGEDTLTVIADRLGKSRTLIYMLDSIGDLTPELLVFTDRGDVTLREAVELRKLPAETQKLLAERIAMLPEEDGEGHKKELRRLCALAKDGKLENTSPEKKPEVKKKPRDLAKIVEAAAKAFPPAGEEIASPRYRKKVEPMVNTMDETILRLLGYRAAYQKDYPMSEELRKKLSEIIG